MAITGTNRGSGGNASASTTMSITPGSNFNAYSTAVLCLAYDNNGAAGEDDLLDGYRYGSNNGIYDSNGNFWISILEGVNSPGAAQADGTAIRIYICHQEIETLTTSDTITVTWDSSVTSKRWTLSEFSTDNGTGIVRHLRGTGAVETGSGTSTTITTASVTSGDAVICMVGSDVNDGTITADSDTTNGSWSTLQSSNGTGMSIYSQYKIVTATATQTYNLSGITSGDYCEGYVILREFASDLVCLAVGERGGTSGTTLVLNGRAGNASYWNPHFSGFGRGTVEVGAVGLILSRDSSYTSITDPIGNAWVSATSSADGSTHIDHCVISTEIPYNTTITLTRSGSTYANYIFLKISSIRKTKPLFYTLGPYQYVSYNTDSTFDTDSVPSESMVICAWLSASIDITSEDTDTTNGIWSNIISSSGSGGLQWKTVTGTGAQSHSVTNDSSSSLISRAAIVITPTTQEPVDPFGWYGVFGI